MLDSIDINSELWTNWRSFFLSLGGMAHFDFAGVEVAQMMFGNINDLDINIKELKVFKGNHEEYSEEHYYQERWNTFRSTMRNTPVGQLISKFAFPKGIPLSPFPVMEKCMGLRVVDSHMEILEGFARVAYNFRVSPAEESCLFTFFED